MYQRTFTLLSLVIASAFLIGCGGPGAPVSGSSDPAAEAANASLSPESAVTPEEAAPEEAAPAAEEAEAKPEESAETAKVSEPEEAKAEAKE